MFPVKIGVRFIWKLRKNIKTIMKTGLKNKLIEIVREKQSSDPSHDINHVLRVLKMAEAIGRKEKADMDIVVAAVLFHDVISYEKNDPKNKFSTEESAQYAKDILKKIPEYPSEKIEKVCQCIELCSFSKGIMAQSVEAKVLQDADMLEATGAISICRTFASSGRMTRPFFSAEDPFCERRVPDDKKYALDLFFTRLLVVESRMQTDFGKKEAKKRTVFLRKFLKELGTEL